MPQRAANEARGRERMPAGRRGARFLPLWNEKFRFACHPGVGCFGECCADLRLILTPYDVLRMKKRLGMNSSEFLAQYTLLDWEENPWFPMVRLKMREEGRRECPFLTAQGCSIYEDRPGACRLYPLGRGARRGHLPDVEEEFYFLVVEDHCRGFEERREWTLGEWLEDQGVLEYNAMNKPWMEIVTSKSANLRKIGEEHRAMFHMASYDLDRFRGFVKKSGFLKRFRLEEDELKGLDQDDLSLLFLAIRWLKFSLLGEMTLEIRH
jgi:Fe-S-cluster containining protein